MAVFHVTVRPHPAPTGSAAIGAQRTAQRSLVTVTTACRVVPARTSTTSPGGAIAYASPASVCARPADPDAASCGPTSAASEAVRVCVRAVLPLGSRTASAFGRSAAPLYPTTSASTVSAWRIFRQEDERPARYVDVPRFATTPSTPASTSECPFLRRPRRTGPGRRQSADDVSLAIPFARSTCHQFRECRSARGRRRVWRVCGTNV